MGKEGLRDKWCSWCFEQTTHEVTQKNLISRSVFKCRSCANSTVKCTTCGAGMARTTKDGTDWLCAHCDHTIDHWGEKPDLRAKGHCSWCMEDTFHLQLQYNYLKRNSYQCTNCSHRTVKCRLCNNEFSRGHIDYDEELCATCSELIDDWSDPEKNRQKMVKQGWCSWCIDRTSHRLEEHHLMGRDVYACSVCEGRTLPCTMCDIGFACGGSGWDNKGCVGCSDTKEVMDKVTLGTFASDSQKVESYYLELRKLRDGVYSKQSQKDYIEEELKRPSKARSEAKASGMLRPFLLMVAMPPAARNRVAASLGWSLITQDYFGDSHAEAWDIIFKMREGIISRANSVLQKVNPLANDCNYYLVLTRVAEAVFGKHEFPTMTFEQSLDTSNSPNDPSIPKIEEYFMRQLVAQQRKNMTAQQKQEEKEAMENEDYARMAEIMRERLGLRSDESVRYAVGVVKKAIHAPNQWGLALYGLSAIQASIPAAAAVTGPMMAGMSAIMPPLAILGSVRLVLKGVNLALGPSLGRLYFPIIMMINQTLLMAAAGRDISEFYTPLTTHDFSEVTAEQARQDHEKDMTGEGASSEKEITTMTSDLSSMMMTTGTDEKAASDLADSSAKLQNEDVAVAPNTAGVFVPGP